MKKFHLIILLFSINLFSQNLDSLYQEYISGLKFSESKKADISTDIKPIKCTTNHVNLIRANYDKLNPQQQDEVSFVLTRPQTETSFVSPDGLFRIHYDQTGSNAPGYDLDELAAALDSSYNFEVNILGYLPPPADNNEGGDNLYDVYLQDMGIIYGETRFFLEPNSPSYMVIDNDFDVHYSKGINGAKVTVAHEFHHAIQVGNYTYRSEDSFYYELVSTSMEEFVFDSINDYYDYMPAYFNNPQAPFYSTYGGGYDMAVWNIYLKDKYGFDVIKKSLENLSDMNAMESIAQSIGSFGGSFKEDLNEFGVWNYFTGSRAKAGMYYEEAANYPRIKPLTNISFTGSSKSLMVNSNPSSNNYVLFTDITRGFPDSLLVVISNTDYRTEAQTSFEYYLYNYEASNSIKINEFYYSKLSSLKKEVFVESAIFNNEIAAEGRTERLEIDYAYPQPFSYAKHSYLFIPTSLHISGRASLNIYTSGMDLVFSSEKDIFATDKVVVRWNGKTDSGDKLPTGVYIYVTKAGDDLKKGKLVIYNE